MNTYLIMKPWLRQALLDRLILIKHMPQILHRCRNDSAPARGSDHKIERAVLQILHDSRGDGRQGPLTRFDKVGRGRLVAEGVGLAGDGEVVHLVVHDDAGLGHDELAAEEEVDSGSERDGHAGGVCRDDVGGSVSGGFHRLSSWREGMEVRSTYVSRDCKPVGS